MSKNYKNYYNTLERMELFLDRSHKIDQSSKLPGLAIFRNFFRALGNYLFGDHKWYSYNRARSVIKFYVNDPSINYKDARSTKIQTIFNKLTLYKNDRFVGSLTQDFKKRFQTNSASNELLTKQPDLKPHQDDHDTGSVPVEVTEPTKTPQPSNPQDSLFEQSDHLSHDDHHSGSVPAEVAEPKKTPQLSNPHDSLFEQSTHLLIDKPAQFSERSEPVAAKKAVIIDNSPFVLPSPRDKIRLPDAPEIPADPKDMEATLGVTTPDSLPPLRAELLFHLSADEFGANSQYEGISSQEILHYVLAYMKQRKNFGGKIAEKQDVIISQLEKAEQIANMQNNPATLKQFIEEAFAKKEPCLIPGGWVGKPFGHSMYYELIPDENGQSASLRIYNTGSGSHEHEQVKLGIKDKIRPLEWKNIKKEKLLEYETLKVLHEFTYLTDHPDKRFQDANLSSNDIYHGLKKQLDVKPEDCSQEESAATDILMKAQRSGICSYRSLMVYFSKHMTKNEFRRFKADIRIQGLITFVEKYGDQIKREDWRLVNKSVKLIGRKINHLFKKKAISLNYVKQAKELLTPIEHWVDIQRNQALKVTVPTTAAAFVPLSFYQVFIPKLQLGSDLFSSSDSSKLLPTATTASHLAEKVHHLELSNPAELQIELNKAIALLETSQSQNEQDAVYFSALEIISRLSKNNDFWISASKPDFKTKENLIIALDRLSKLLFDASIEKLSSNTTFPEVNATLNKLLNIQLFLIGMKYDLKPAPKQYLSTTLIHDQNALDEYTPKADHSSLFEITFKNKINELGAYALRSPFESLLASPDKLESLISQYDMTVEKEQLKRVKDDLPKEALSPEMHYMALYKSSVLPDWLKAIRDTEVRKISLDRYSHEILNKNAVSEPQYEIGYQSYFGIPVCINNPRFRQTKIDPFATERKFSSKMNWVNTLRSNIKDFLSGNLGCNDQDYEKLLLATQRFAKVPEMDPKVVKEIAHIFITPSVSLVQALAFFEKNPSKIRDPDYQNIFNAACFEATAISSLNPRLAALALNFLQKHLDQALIEQNGAETAVFLLRMHRYFSQFNAYADCKDKIDGQKEIEKLLAGNKNDHDKTVLYIELAGYLSEKNALTDDELQSLVTAVTWKEQHLLAEHLKDPQVELEIQKCLHHHALKIEQLLLKGGVNQEALNNIYQNTTGKAPPTAANWEVIQAEGQEIVFTLDNSIVFYPLKGRLDTLNENGFLPLELRQNPTFKKLFSGITRGIVHSDSIFSFKDGFQNKICVKIENKKVTIEKELNGHWYQYIDSKDIRGIQRRELIDNCTHWASIGEPNRIIFIPDGKNNPEYTLTEDANKKNYQLTRLNDQAVLSGKSFLFSHFEDPSSIYEWFSGDDEKNIVEVELPRFNLTFKTDADNPQKLISVQYPGWHVSDNQEVLKLGSSATHIVLEDKNGKKQVLLPELIPVGRTHKEVLLPAMSYERHIQMGVKASFEHYTYALSEKGEPKAESLEANFYLCMTFAAHQEYESAAAILRTYGNKLSPYSPKEIQFLKTITELDRITGDESGEMKALSLYAALLLTHNRTASEDTLNLLPKLYKQYLERYKHITVLRLSKDEELGLLKNLLSQNFDPYFFTRLSELKPSYAHYFPYSKDVSRTSKTQVLDPRSELACVNLFPDNAMSLSYFEKNLANSHLTRSDEKIKHHLLDYLYLAFDGSSDEKRSLLTACYFMQSQKEQQIQAIGYLIEAIIQSPNHFNRPPEKFVDNTSSEYTKYTDTDEFLKYKDTVKKWWTQLSNTAQNIISQDTKTFNPPQEITPRHFRLDEPQEVLPELNFTFNYKEAIPLAATQELSRLLAPLPDQSHISVEHYRELKTLLKEKEARLDQKANPLEKQEWERLKGDLRAYKQQKNENCFELIGDIEAVQKALSYNLEDQKQQLIDIEKELLEIANLYPEEDVLRTLRFWGGNEKNITLGDIFVSFAKKETSSLQKLNPHLSQENVDRLYTLTSNYLTIASTLSQKERCLKSCEEIKNAPDDEKNDLKKLLVDQIAAKRAYDVKKHPEYLVFEYYSEMIIRKNQVQMVDALLKGETRNPVMEMIMGSGKSKVLLPLIGLLRANKKELSLLIVPEPLFEDVSTETEKILREDFSKSLKTLYFDRNSTFNYRSLEEIRDTLKSAIKHQNCLIMTSKSISSLLLKFIEHTENLYKQDSIEDENTPLMQEIIEILSTMSNPLIDEVDTVLNVLHEVCFSLGEKRPPKRHEGAVVGELYNLLYNDAELKKLARLDSDPDANNEALPLTKPLYESKVKKILAEKLFMRLNTLDLKNRAMTQQLREFLQTLSPKQRKLLLAFITRDEKLMPKAQRYYDTLDANIQDIFALAGEEICHLLPHTLVKTADINYGLYRHLFATPFLAADTPNKSSLYESPYITMNYTFALYYKKGINEDTLETILKDLHNQAMMQRNSEGLLFTETDAYKKFLILKGNLEFSLTDYTHEQLVQLKNAINRSSLQKRLVIEDYIFPKIEIYDAKLACNPLMFAALLNKLSGFTGTLMSGGSMHRKITPKPEIGTDAKTLATLYAMKDAPVLKVNKGSLSSMLSALKVQYPVFDLFSDGGGYLKEGGAINVARQMAMTFGKPVVFYDAHNQKTVTDGAKEEPFSVSKLKENERLTFLDQSHTTGSDVTQKQSAIEIVTIGKDMTLRDFSQAVWRARKLGKGQKVVYLVDDEVDAIIRQKLDLPAEKNLTFIEIYEFVVQNKCEKQGDDSFKAFKKELWSMVQQLLTDSLKRKDLSAVNKKAAYTRLREYWIKPQGLTAGKEFGQPALLRPKAEVLAEEKKRVESILKELSNELFFLKDAVDGFLSELDGLIDRYEQLLHPFVISPIGDDSETVEIEQELKAETDTKAQTLVQTIVDETSTNTALLVDHLKGVTDVSACLKAIKQYIQKNNLDPEEHSFLKYQEMWINGNQIPDELKFSLNRYIDNIYSLSQWMKSQPELHEFASLYTDIQMVRNVLETKRDDVNKKYGKFFMGDISAEYSKLFTASRVPIHHLRVMNDHVTILSAVESKFSNYNLTLGFHKGDAQLTHEAFQKIIKIKLLNGDCYYSKQEMEFLEKWIPSVGVDKIHRFMLQHVLRNRPEELANFPGTPLGKLLQSLT